MTRLAQHHGVPEKRSQAGKKTYKKIVECAYGILLNESYEQLTMQGIAKRLGIRLSNVQYYFNNRDKLIRALLEHNNQLYYEEWEDLFARVGNNPERRLNAFIELNLKDVKSANTRHFFIQLWPLLSTADNYSGKLMKEMYEPYISAYINLIQDLTPGIPEQEARIRAEIIASMLEGFMVTTAASPDCDKHRRQRDKAVIAAAFAVATQPLK